MNHTASRANYANLVSIRSVSLHPIVPSVPACAKGGFFKSNQVRWPGGKSVRFGSWRLRFDSGQTNDFIMGIHSLRAA